MLTEVDSALFEGDFAVAVSLVLTFTMCTAMGQVRGVLSRGLSYVNLDVNFWYVDSLSDRPAVINV